VPVSSGAVDVSITADGVSTVECFGPATAIHRLGDSLDRLGRDLTHRAAALVDPLLAFFDRTGTSINRLVLHRARLQEGLPFHGD
jgi:hypothetical protein